MKEFDFLENLKIDDNSYDFSSISDYQIYIITGIIIGFLFLLAVLVFMVSSFEEEGETVEKVSNYCGCVTKKTRGYCRCC